MPTLFTRILEGTLPGRFVWRDDLCGAFLSINPLRPGHVLIVPRAEVDHFQELDPAVAAHLMQVAQHLAKALMRAFRPPRVGMVIAGLEVPHVHLHLVPIRGSADLEFRNAEASPKDEHLEEAAAKIRTALRELGYTQVSD